MGAKPNYPYVTDAIRDISSGVLPDRLGKDSVSAVSKVVFVAASDAIYESEEAFIAYLDSLRLNENSYGAGNTLNSTSGMINASGLMGTLRKYLTEHQNPKNGLWEDEVSYQSVNGLMKLCTFFGSSFPNAERALDSAIKILLLPIDDELSGITFVYNPWVAIANLLNAVSDEKERELRQMLYSNAPAIFDMMAEKLGAFAKSDGGFSYQRDFSAPFSQDALVAVSGSAESDVNATTIAISTVLVYMSDVYDIDFPYFFGTEDSRYFLEELGRMNSIIKSSLLSEEPEIITFDDFDPEDGEIAGNMVLNPHPNIVVNIGDPETDGNDYVWVESAIVRNPTEGADPSDLVYYVKDKIKADAEDGEKKMGDEAFSTEFTISNLGSPGNCYVFEADMLFDGISDSSHPAAQLTFMRSKTALISAWVDIYQYTRFGKNYLRIQEYFAGADGIKENEIASGIPTDEWFKLRVEMYKDYSGEGGELMTKLKFYVNGKYAGSSDSGHYENGAYKDFLVSGVKLAYYRHSESAFYLNNVFVAKTNDVYKNESIPSYDYGEVSSDKVIWDFEDGIPSVDSFFGEMFYDDEELGFTSIDPKNWTSELDSLYGEKQGTKLYCAEDPANTENKVLKAYSQNTKKSQYKATVYIDDLPLSENASTLEIEFDYYFDKISWIYAENLLSVNLHNSNGKALASVSLVALDWQRSHNTRKAGIKIGNKLLEGFTLLSERWYSFKLVYHIDELDPEGSKMLVYVESDSGGYVCIANENLPNKRDTVSGVGFEFHCYDVRGTQYVDDISVSRTEREYIPEIPVKGEDVDLPVPEDNSIYVTDSQRGEGKYFKDGIDFSSVTIKDLISKGLMAENTVRGDGVEKGNRELSVKNEKDAYLLYKSLGSGNHAINFVSGAHAYDGFIFETDIMLDGVDTEEGRDIRFTGTKTNGTADSGLYAFNIKICKNYDEEKGGYILTIGGNEQKIIIPDKTWINLRLEAFGTKKGSALEFYINGELVIRQALTDSIEGIVGVELYTPATYNGHGWEEGEIRIDNTYVSGFGDPPEQIEIGGNSRDEGKNKDSAISFENTTYEDIISSGAMANNSYRGDGVSEGNRVISIKDIEGNAALVYEATGSGNHALNFVSRSAAVDGFILEFDIRFDKMVAGDGRGIAFIGTTSNGTANAALWAINIKVSENPDKAVGGYILTLNGTERQFLIPDGVWTNIRLEIEGVNKGSPATLYINGEEAVFFSTTASISGIKGVELYTNSTYGGVIGFTGGSVALDNVYVSGMGKAPNVDVLEHGPRGEGEYKDKALSYTDVTYEELISLGHMAINKNRGDGVSADHRTISIHEHDGDNILLYGSNGSGNHSLNFVADTTVSYTSFVFETDISLEWVNAASGRDIRFTGSSKKGLSDSDLWGFNLRLCVNPDSAVGGYVISIPGTEDTLILPNDCWVNLRLVAEGINKGDALKLYVNGELKLISTLTSSIAGIKGVELYTASTYGGAQGYTEGAILLDNTYVGAISAPDEPSEPELPDEPEIPDDGEDTEFEIGNGGENIDGDAWVDCLLFFKSKRNK